MVSLWRRFMEAPDYFQASPWFPNPFICARDMAITGTRETIDRLPWNGIGEWLNGTWYWLSLANYKDPAVIIVPLLIAVGLTLLRIFLNWAIFRSIPKWYNLMEEAASKFPESIWKVLFYSIAWVWGMYLVTSAKTNIFFNLRSHWDSWSPTEPLEPGLYWLYMLQMGFYYHSIYAAVYIETIRRDFAVIMTHHLLTLGLLLFSYIVRFHTIGLLLLNFLDIGDVFLELSKTLVYFKDRNNKLNRGTEMLANICFGVFTLQYMLCRLYWYPTKAIYSAMHVSVLTFPEGPFYLLFTPMLWGLFAMQAYWFMFILRLLWKILVMGHDLEDNREFSKEEEEERERMIEKKQD